MALLSRCVCILRVYEFFFFFFFENDVCMNIGIASLHLYTVFFLTFPKQNVRRYKRKFVL